MTLSSLTVITACPDQVSSNLDGETIVLHFKSGTYYGLNEVGSRIWHLIQTPKSIHEIQEILLSEYDVTEEDCYRELLNLLQTLQSEELIQIQSPMSDYHALSSKEI